MSRGAPGVRYAELDREAPYTRVQLVIDLDGGTRCDVNTGIAVFDELLGLFARSACIDLGLNVDADGMIDDHHIMEDVAIAIGTGIRAALEESDAVRRYADCQMVEDDALVAVAMDFSGHGKLFSDLPFRRDKIGQIATENIVLFFSTLCVRAGITAHVRKLVGENDHHVAEAAFKGFGTALHKATRVADNIGNPKNSNR